MPVAKITAPDGRVARITVPDNASPEEAQLVISDYLSKISKVPSPEEPQPSTMQQPTSEAQFEGVPSGREPTMWEKARPYVAPTLEGLGAAGGAIAGGILGLGTGGMATPAGAMLGGGLGLASAREVIEIADVYFGDKAPRQGLSQVVIPATNLLEGAVWEGGGRVVAPMVAKGAAKVMGTLRDLSPSRREAFRIAQASTEGKAQQVRNALATARPGEIPAEVIARNDVNVPVTQALLKESKGGAPTYFSDAALAKEASHLDDLASIAKGGTQVESIEAQKAAKETLRNVTGPEREQILKSVSDTSNVMVDLEQEVARNRLSASKSVDDVRRFASAEQKATDLSKQVYKPSGVPRVPGRYTHAGELAKIADEAMTEAAAGSLNYGKAARLAQSQLDELTEAGLKPLKADDLIRRVTSLKTKHHAGNDLVEGAIDDFVEGVQKWTNEKGVIDPWALDALRKNAVNSTIGRLRPGFDAKAANNASAGVLSDITPIIDDAFDASGGAGYKAYRESFRKGMNEISNTKLGAKLLDLYKTKSYDKFIKIMGNDAPKEVEKILGPGRNNIASELGEKEFTKLKKIADDLMISKEVTRQAGEEGAEKALRRVIDENSKKLRLPNVFNVFATASNKALETIEAKVNKKTFEILTNAAKDAKTLDDLLANVPATERIKILKVMANPEEFSKLIPTGLISGTGVATTNALSEKKEKRNALSSRH